MESPKWNLFGVWSHQSIEAIACGKIREQGLQAQ